MHARLIAFVLPLVVVVGGALGVALFIESARRVSVEAAVASSDDLRVALERVDRARSDREVEEAIESAADQHRWVVATTPTGALAAGSPTAQRIAERFELIGEADTIWPWTEGARRIVGTVESGIGPVTVELFERAQPAKAATSRRWAFIAAGITTVAAAVAAAMYPLSRVALRPVDRLNATARSLAAGHFDARAHVGSGAPELRELAESINQMAETVASGVQRERSFVSSASHHFGNLLTPLRLRIETLDRQDHRVEEALAELDRLETTAERLLLLNRAEEGDVVPIIQDIANAVDETIRSWEVVTELKGIELLRAGSAEASGWAVPGAVEEVLDNLIDNSVKYGDRTPITVSVLRGLHNVRIVVGDRGPGMSDHEIEHAMGRFWRGPTQQGKPGSGLGLAIADALATRCGGRLEVRTSPNGGLESSLVLERAG